MAATEIQIDEKTKLRTNEPKKWKVVFLNDNVTPMDFVINVLSETFKHTPESAAALTLEIHNSGSAVVGVYSFEIAESKAIEATQLARASSYPLQIKMEEE